jgi:hypothetical protein
MVQDVYSANPQEQYEATQKFRKLLSIGKLGDISKTQGAKLQHLTQPLHCRAQPSYRGGDQAWRRAEVCGVPAA